ncbi:MAG: ethanolamine utilization protein EutP [Lachnospiraceae bacterium]|nr:ethanolamine utilization protein EutP [Lachnospiraceae bacterium]
MKKIILNGRVGCGKTTLTQALKGEKLHYHKTQYINHFDAVIDTPGEYAEIKELARALFLYSYEADVIGLMASSMEDYSLYSPNIASLATRPVIGIVTQIDRPGARPDWAELFLRNAGCKDIFFVSAKTGEGIQELLDYLRDE